MLYRWNSIPSFDWTGDCLVTAVAGAGYDQDGPCDEETGVGCDFAAGDAEDFTANGFTGGFFWYGWDANILTTGLFHLEMFQ